MQRLTASNTGLSLSEMNMNKTVLYYADIILDVYVQ